MCEKKDLAIGGQAIIEGVMMRNEGFIATAIRNPKGEIIIEKKPYVSLVKRYKALNVIIIRGFINLLEMLYFGMKIMLHSADVALGAETDTKLNKWEMFSSAAIGIGFSILLFVVLPAFAFVQLKTYIANTFLLNVVEGLIRISIFLGFLLFTLSMKDMRRVYEYHGAEHKSIHAYEAGLPLEVEHVKAQTTLHPRCGTSFVLIVLLISIVVFTFLGRPDFLHRVAYKLALLPLISGVAYEIVKLTRKYKSGLMLVLVYPGLMMQKITTREPDDGPDRSGDRGLEGSRLALGSLHWDIVVQEQRFFHAKSIILCYICTRSSHNTGKYLVYSS